MQTECPWYRQASLSCSGGGSPTSVGDLQPEQVGTWFLGDGIHRAKSGLPGGLGPTVPCSARPVAQAPGGPAWTGLPGRDGRREGIAAFNLKEICLLRGVG